MATGFTHMPTMLFNSTNLEVLVWKIEWRRTAALGHVDSECACLHTQSFSTSVKKPSAKLPWHFLYTVLISNTSVSLESSLSVIPL